MTHELPIDSGQVARFVDIATFMRAPRIADLDRVDIGLFGIPFDLGLAYRPGSRHAPGGRARGVARDPARQPDHAA